MYRPPGRRSLRGSGSCSTPTASASLRYGSRVLQSVARHQGLSRRTASPTGSAVSMAGTAGRGHGWSGGTRRPDGVQRASAPGGVLVVDGDGSRSPGRWGALGSDVPPAELRGGAQPAARGGRESRGRLDLVDPEDERRCDQHVVGGHLHSARYWTSDPEVDVHQEVQVRPLVRGGWFLERGRDLLP